MSRLLLLSLFALLLSVRPAVAGAVPEQLQKNFEKLYPYVTDAEWKSENNTYIVTFTLASRSVTVHYDASGNMLETAIITNPETLPQPVLSYVTTHYNQQKIRRAEKVTDARDQVRWRILVGKEILLTCDENGTCAGN